MKDLTSDEQIQHSELTDSVAFITSDNEAIKKEITDHSETYVLPSIKIRYASILIDAIVITLFAFSISSILDKIESVPDFVRGTLFIFLLGLYEPLLLSTGCTIGQLLLNIRVRRFNDPQKKIYFHMALIRFVIKVSLGWLSFITVTFNKNRRAIHDFAGNSVMITNTYPKI
ncbi:MAG: RDD family protein [Bacteroidales bacterium]|nr:RDD family protein [Bacteroidales bacterium]